MTRLPLIAWLGQRDGVAHTATARAAGYSGRAIADAVDRQSVLRVRRSWLVAPGADPRLAAAASAGGRVTCVSATARAGLWEPPSDGLVHVAVKPTASRVGAEGLVVHWGTGPSPVPPHAVEDPLLDALFHVARCQPRRLAFAVWESAVHRDRIDLDELRAVQWHSTAAREIAERMSTLSESGIETIFVHGARSLGLPVRQQVWIDGHPLDAVIGDRLLVQIDGFAHHSTARDRRRDIRADARLVLRGYTVLRFDWYQIMFEWPEVERTLLLAVAQGLHLAPASRRA
jgi:very-short-patch-repair endonuclease